MGDSPRLNSVLFPQAKECFIETPPRLKTGGILHVKECYIGCLSQVNSVLFVVLPRLNSVLLEPLTG